MFGITEVWEALSDDYGAGFDWPRPDWCYGVGPEGARPDWVTASAATQAERPASATAAADAAAPAEDGGGDWVTELFQN